MITKSRDVPHQVPSLFRAGLVLSVSRSSNVIDRKRVVLAYCANHDQCLSSPPEELACCYTCATTLPQDMLRNGA